MIQTGIEHLTHISNFQAKANKAKSPERTKRHNFKNKDISPPQKTPREREVQTYFKKVQDSDGKIESLSSFKPKQFI